MNMKNVKNLLKSLQALVTVLLGVIICVSDMPVMPLALIAILFAGNVLLMMFIYKTSSEEDRSRYLGVSLMNKIFHTDIFEED